MTTIWLSNRATVGCSIDGVTDTIRGLLNNYNEHARDPLHLLTYATL